ncbi:hypothetical protein [Pseudobutyrivibrio sp.]|uniref:hypothetical protein n=1 Tax=Pseudobutyrivibrio sp. TaxID=2014367 RepID=UPI001B52750C|nr:hypothetical protein [Pseudobutyrivibrio sp.]MBP3263070.1 hypothetical protein [Pseudobutyrivibrio sp.]
MLSEKEITRICIKCCGKEPIGYTYFEDWNWIIPEFSLPANLEDIPTGSTMYLDSDSGQVGYTNLPEILKYDGQKNKIVFEGKNLIQDLVLYEDEALDLLNKLSQITEGDMGVAVHILYKVLFNHDHLKLLNQYIDENPDVSEEQIINYSEKLKNSI